MIVGPGVTYILKSQTKILEREVHEFVLNTPDWEWGWGKLVTDYILKFFDDSRVTV